MIAYFAHSKLDYGTAKEKKALSKIYSILIRYMSVNSRVFCPNSNLGETGRMENYLRVVAWCDILIAMEHNGAIGKGVHDEIVHAKRQGKTAYVLRGNDMIRIKNVSLLPAADWKYRYAEVNIDPTRVYSI